jgi:hypothetical protein
MRPTTRLFAPLIPLLLIACTEQSLPQFDNPVPVTVPSGKPAYGPRLTQSTHDDAILSWMERRADGSSLGYSTYYDGSWQAQKIAISDEQMFVNWADLPAVTAIGPKTLLAYWLSYTADAPYAYQVLTAVSEDDGASWSTPGSPHDDGTPTEHGFVSSFPDENGTGLIWLDGRNTPDDGMTLRGATLKVDGQLHDENLLDDLVCDCCQTDIAVTEAGPVAVYRNRTAEEVRDIYVTRYRDGKWRPGTPISNDGWVISGCPVNGPSIAAAEKKVVVAWFTAANNTPTVKVALSTNAGKSFSEPAEVSSRNAQGHVGVALIDRHSFAISWMESEKKGTYAIKLRSVTFDGQMGRVHTIGRTSLARTVPQLVRVADHLVLAWTDEISDLSKVVSVKVPILGFYD